MSPKSRLPFLGVALSCMLYNACKVEDYDLSDLSSDSLQVKTAIDAPLGRTSISIADMMKRQKIEGLTEDESGLLVFSYDSTVHFTRPDFSINTVERKRKKTATSLMKEFFGESTISQADFKKYGYTFNLRNGDIIDLGTTIELNLNSKVLQGSRIDSVLLADDVKAKLKLNTDIPGLIENSALVIKYPDFYHDKDGFKELSVTSPRNEVTCDFGGGMLHFNGKDTIKLVGYLQIIKPVQIRMNKDNYLEIKGSLEKPQNDFKIVWGVFKSDKNKSGSISLDVDLFDNSKMDMNLILANPKANFSVISNLGVPTVMTVKDITATSAEGEKVSAIFEDGSSTYKVNLDRCDVVGESKELANMTFDSKNGQIDKIINVNPKKVSSSYCLTLPENVDLNMKGNYFFREDSYADVKYSVDIPLQLRKNSYIAAYDTIKNINLHTIIKDFIDVDYVKVTCNMVNSLPFRATATVRFQALDSTTKKLYFIDCLTRQFSAKAGSVGADLFVDKPATSVDTVVYKGVMADTLRYIKHAIIEYRVDVDDFEQVKVKSTDKIKADISAFGKASALVKKLKY